MEEVPRWEGEGMKDRMEAWATEGEGGRRSDMPSWCSEVREGTLSTSFRPGKPSANVVFSLSTLPLLSLTLLANGLTGIGNGGLSDDLNPKGPGLRADDDGEEAESITVVADRVLDIGEAVEG